MSSSILLGRLTDPNAHALDMLKHEPIVLYTVISIGVIGALVLAAITLMGWWKPLWRNWITTVDHKRIGIMYIILAIVMLVRGFADAIMMRTHQAMAFVDTAAMTSPETAKLAAESAGFLDSDHYSQIFTAHGTIMIFFMATPMLFGIFNYIIPLQIGARDVAFPFLNNLGFWITFAGAILINISLGLGAFARGGWLNYAPYSDIIHSPGTGTDYYLWSLQLSGIATTIGAVNFIATIMTMRAPGMSMFKMPVFTWTSLVSNILILMIYPPLTVVFILLALDRYAGAHFFTNDGQGNPMLYVDLVWVFGHPEVYVLVLPAFGILSEIVPNFSHKRLFGYTSMVWATLVILILSFIVWGHHFFTMGGGTAVNTVFAIATMIIAIPTGVKVFNWLFTMYKGRISFEPPMLWAMGMIFTFVGGGLTGVLLSIVPADWQIHNSAFLVAHFHHTIIGGVVFSYLGGLAYWFPKVFGVKPNRALGIASFWCWFIGFHVAFYPIYYVGLEGITRRLQHFTDPGLQPALITAMIGVFIIALGIICFVLQVLGVIVYGFRHRGKLPVQDNDSWGAGRSLEWATSSPPPAYNFATIPTVHTTDAFWDMKQSGHVRQTTGFHKIHMPSNTAAGFWAGMLLVALGFGLVWHIWWLVAVTFVGTIAVIIAHSFLGNEDGYYIPAEEVQKTEDELTAFLTHKGATA
ncbi:MAG: Cytochrome o ubiquinol oxidase subunit I [Candidatus Tokpelaia hoelldobleri]|uniref:Cytochrome o ubiquinol oxidase subunit I n=1 Tax=Candidatus Tokpelaia hoelldobleri TaxID=1902579 RepID=A0A1U9JVE3_9HYPH|nr:MAG: Cytochrome o ubiquinol oxidase subunit I [Candidatus Tokpelaia hoelldoblerii]